MNAHRVAELHREIARLHAELAEELDDPTAAPSERPAAPPRLRSVRKPRSVIRPDTELSEKAAARADRILRSRGLR